MNRHPICGPPQGNRCSAEKIKYVWEITRYAGERVREPLCHSDDAAVSDEGALRMRTLRSPVGGRSPMWESHVKSSDFIGIQRESRTFEIATVCLRKPRNDIKWTFLTV